MTRALPASLLPPPIGGNPLHESAPEPDECPCADCRPQTDEETNNVND